MSKGCGGSCRAKRSRNGTLQLEHGCETSFKLFPCPGEGWWLSSPEGLRLGVRHLGCCCGAPEISSHPTEWFICCWRLPSVLLLAKGFAGSEPGHEEARTAWQSSMWATCAAWSALPTQIKLLQSLRSPFQHAPFPAASISQAKMGWGGGMRYCNLFPPAMTAYAWLLSNSRGYSGARLWLERGAELPAALECPQVTTQCLEQLAGLWQC